MQTCSFHRITLGGLVLLDHDERVASPFSIGLLGKAQEGAFVRGTWGKNYGRGNRKRPIRWTRILDFSTIEERLGFEIALPRAYPVGQSGELIVEIKGGSTQAIADFVLTSCNAVEVPLKPLRLILSFEGIGGEDRVTDRAGLGGPGWEAIGQGWGLDPLPAQLSVLPSDQPAELAVLHYLNPLTGRYYEDIAGPEYIWNNGSEWIIGTYPSISTWEGPASSAGPIGNYTKVGDPGFPVTVNVTLPAGAPAATNYLPAWGSIIN